MFIFAIIGLSIFGDSCPRHFGTLGSSETNYQGHPLMYSLMTLTVFPGMFTLFVCVTQDGWMGITEELQVMVTTLTSLLPHSSLVAETDL